MNLADAIKRGKLVRSRLTKTVERAVSINPNDVYPHTYIYSPPGLGKTHSVNTQLDAMGVEHYEISGAMSMFAFGVSLAVIRYNRPTGKIIINVDDCDGIFKNEENINIMKNVLSGSRRFTYNKSVKTLLTQYSELQQAAVEHFSGEEQVGFSVPCDDFIFIFTSNFSLPTDDEAAKAAQTGGNKSVRKVHLNAIRSRCKTIDFNLDKLTHFGWLADVCLNENLAPTVPVEVKHEMLTFVMEQWDNLTERSIRTLEKMAQVYLDEPTDYQLVWEIDFLK
jgi:hypothetical protein